jgi:transcriptional regulator with XRE-family HTH domain
MSFDNGPDYGADPFPIKARLRAAMQEAGLSWVELCRRAGVDSGDAQRAVERAESNLQESLPILSKLALGLGRDINWLLTGATDGETAMERTRRLVWEFIDGGGIARGCLHAQQFMQWVLRRQEAMPTTNAAVAFRTSTPHSVIDIVRLYKVFRREVGRE